MIIYGVVLGSRGVVTLGAWLSTNDIKSARELARRMREGDDVDASLDPSLNQALRQEVVRLFLLFSAFLCAVFCVRF